MARTRWVNYYLRSGGRLTREPPGHEFTIDLQATSNVFKRGHRIPLHITGSNFPLWDRNLNTGHDPAMGNEMQMAHQTVCQDTLRPSRIVLPVIAP